MSLRDPRSASPEPRCIFGSLSLVNHKTHEAINSFEIDSRNLTIGRDDDCDVRIYATSVSRLHCEINFDVLTDKATLIVHGLNGVRHNDVHVFPPAALPLSDGDIISFDKRKVFRFEYLSISYTAYPSLLDSPMPTPRPATSIAQIFPPSPVGAKTDEQQDVVPPMPTPSRRMSARRAVSRRQSQRMHVMSRSQASPVIEELVTRATYQSPLARRSSRLSSGNDLLSGGRMDESMEMALKEQDEEESEGEEAKPINGSHGDTSTDDDEPLVWLEQREEPELTGPEEDSDEVVQEEDEAPVASPVNDTASPATRAIPSAAFHTPQPPKRVVRAPRTSLAARTRKDMFNMPPRPEIQSPQRGAEDTVQGVIDEEHAVAQSAATPSRRQSTPAAAAYAELMASTPSTPIAQNHEQPQAMAYKTPRSIPLPESMDTPYASEDNHDIYSEQQELSMEDPDDSVEELSAEQAQVYLSPRAVPLPPAADTPYQDVPQTPSAVHNVPRTPASAIPPRLAQPIMATPAPMPQTPRNSGQTSLRRGILLKSARKALEAQIRRMEYGQSLVAQPAVAPAPHSRSPILSTGKMTSQQASKTPSRIALPSPGLTEYSGEYSGEASDEDSEHAPCTLQFVHETGQGESDYSTDSEDDDEDDSFRQTSVIHPTISTLQHQAVDSSSISPGMRHKLIQLMKENPESDEDVDKSLDTFQNDESFSEKEEEEPGRENSEQDGESPVEGIASQEQQEKQFPSDGEGETLEGKEQLEANEVDPASIPLPETPIAARGLPSRFYTPQIIVSRPRAGRGRKSLSDRYGPPVRFERVGPTPVRKIGSMGPPVRPSPGSSYAQIANEVETGGWSLSPTSQLQEEVSRMESSKRLERRKSLATPRTLPAPPTEGFENLPMPIATPTQPPGGETLRTPVSGGFTAVAPSSSSDEEAEEASPLVGLKKKIKAIRRQSRQSLSAPAATVSNLQRRMTVGFALPSTPAAIPPAQMRLMRTATPGARFAQPAAWSPRTPTGASGVAMTYESPQTTASLRDINPVEAEILDEDLKADAQECEASFERDSESNVSEEHAVTFAEENSFSEVPEDLLDGRPQANEVGHFANDEDRTAVPDAQRLKETVSTTPTHDQRARTIATPSFKGIKEMLRLPAALPTPSFVGIRDMLKEAQPGPATPDFKGLRDMIQEPKAFPETPAFAGLRNMFALPAQQSTPAMDGIPEMFEQASPVAKRTESDTAEVEPLPSVTQAPSRSRTRTVVADAVSTKSTATAARSTSAATRTRRKADVESTIQSTAEAVVPVRRTRTAKAAVDELPSITTASRPSRSKKASAQPDVQPDVLEKDPSDVASSTSTLPARRAASTKAAAAPTRTAPARRTARSAATKPVETVETPAGESDDEEDPLDAMEVTIPESKPAPKARAAKSSAAATKSSAAKATTSATRVTRAAPIRKKVEPLQDSTEQEQATPDAETEAAKPKARATRAAKASAEDAKPSAASVKTTRTARTTAKTASTAASTITKATATRKTAVATEVEPVKPIVATRTRAKVVAVEPEAPKRVTRARK